MTFRSDYLGEGDFLDKLFIRNILLHFMNIFDIMILLF